MGCESPERAIEEFRKMMKDMDLNNPMAGNLEAEMNVLSTSVNPVRLKNNPILIDTAIAHLLYESIVSKKKLIR
jgi:hypothetical protein